ncbi:MAG: FxsA family protein [Planctomycetes bacterium]|nr:FxsA family protein [Planctomycetota bacterium]
MFGLLLLLAGAVAILDLYLLYLIAVHFGWLAFMACLFLPAMLGGELARRQGRGVVQRIQSSMLQGLEPAPEMVSGVLLLATGLLFIYPGPLTTALGALLLIPPLRRLVARAAIAGLVARLSRGGMTVVTRQRSETSYSAGPAVPGGLKDVEGRDLGSQPGAAPPPSPQLPQPGAPPSPDAERGDAP